VVCVNCLLQKAQQLAGCIQNIIHAKFPNVFCDFEYISTNHLNIILMSGIGERHNLNSNVNKFQRIMIFHTSFELLEKSRIRYTND